MGVRNPLSVRAGRLYQLRYRFRFVSFLPAVIDVSLSATPSADITSSASPAANQNGLRDPLERRVVGSPTRVKSPEPLKPRGGMTNRWYLLWDVPGDRAADPPQDAVRRYIPVWLRNLAAHVHYGRIRPDGAVDAPDQ